jgi:hypothetical protein
VAPQLFLGEYQPAVHFHLEYAARGLDQVHVRIGKRLSDLGRQTGGPRLVVSDDAVLDRDAHAVNISGA